MSIERHATEGLDMLAEYPKWGEYSREKQLYLILCTAWKRHQSNKDDKVWPFLKDACERARLLANKTEGKAGR